MLFRSKKFRLSLGKLYFMPYMGNACLRIMDIFYNFFHFPSV